MPNKMQIRERERDLIFAYTPLVLAQRNAMVALRYSHVAERGSRIDADDKAASRSEVLHTTLTVHHGACVLAYSFY